MKAKTWLSKLAAVAALALIGAGTANAQRVTVGSTSVTTGATSATIAVTFDSAYDPTGAPPNLLLNSYDVRFNFVRTPPAGAVVTSGLVTVAGGTGSCGGLATTNPTGTQVITGHFVASGTIASETTCNVTFPLDPAAPVGVYNFTLAFAEFTDSAFNTFTPAADQTVMGSITISAGPQPTFNGAPAPGPITINTFVGGGGNTSVINVNNTGQVGSTLNVTAAFGGGSAAQLSVAPATPQAIAQGAAAVPFTITCNNAAVGTFTGTLNFTSNATGSPHQYAVTCNVAAAPSPTYSSVPAPATAINLSAAVGGTATATVVVTNTGTANLNVGAPSGLSAPITIAPNTAQNGITPAGTRTYTITCAPVAIGTTNQTLTLGPTNETVPASYTYPVACTGTNPAYTSAPTAPGGTITINTAAGTPGTATLTVTNTGSVGSTLNVNAPAGLSGVLSIAPNTAQAIAQGGAGVPYTITCNSADAGTFTQTLTMAHNAAGSPATYTVTCTATGPEFSSAPPPPGPVTISAIPSTTGTQNIVVSNPGSAPLTVTCTATGTGVSVNPASPTALTVNPGTTGNLAVSCTVPAAGGTSSTGSLACTTNDANEAAVNFNVVCQALQTSIPTLSIFGKALLSVLVLGLGMLGFGLRRQSV